MTSLYKNIKSDGIKFEKFILTGSTIFYHTNINSGKKLI
jgi:hypothetical protein